MADLTLGLDLGPNSLGWALIDEEGNRILGCGVRVFPEGVDRDQQGREASKNESRRVARGMRRQIARRAKRKRLLRRRLVHSGLLPDVALRDRYDESRIAWERDAFRAGDPYALRRRGLSAPLTLHELGRALLHLGQRRGFLSNRKTDRDAAQRKETSALLEEISGLESELAGRTLGQHLAELRGDDPATHHLTRVRGKHTSRAMYEREFDAIWEAQRVHHPSVLTESLRDALHSAIFFQRPLRPPSPDLVGRCELEPRLARCPRADRRAQWFRLYQEVNNLRVIDGLGGEERPLSTDERERLIAYLAPKKEASFVDLRKRLFEQHENVRFNLERGGRTKLLGIGCDAALGGGKKFFGKAWLKVPDDARDRIVAALVDADEGRLRFALEAAGLDADEAPRLLDEAPVAAGYASYSLHAIKKLLPHLRRGLPLSSADPLQPCALREAGYVMPWEHRPDERRFLPEPPMVANPLVRQALHEVRKVVNAVLRELVHKNGHRLARIRIELARETRGTAEQRTEQSYRMRKNEQRRAEAAEKIREYGIANPSRALVNRYLLWQEQDQACAYTGAIIDIRRLLDRSSDVDVDHILPYSRTLDDSQMNRVVCLRSANADKGDRTPYEWLAATRPEEYERVVQRARKLLYPKMKRFLTKSVDIEDFIARQLVDTAYIATQARQYLLCLGAEDVLCPRGEHTADLRHHWGLDTLLEELRDAPAWQAASELPRGKKNRLDHRHHAIDAIVVALTNRGRLQELTRLRRKGGPEVTGELVNDPWPTFRDDVSDAVRRVHVSHRVARKVAGALHEETIYGATQTPGEVVVRKDLTALKCAMVPGIRDKSVRTKVVARLREFGIEPGRGQDSIPAEVWKAPLWMNEEKHIRIRSVRIVRNEGSVVSIRGGAALVKPGNIHHVCLFEVTDERGRTKRDAVFVSMLEAMNRVRRREPVIQTVDPDCPDARFLYSLSRNECVLLEHNGEQALYRFETAASTSKQMWFRHHAAGGKASEKIGQVSKKPNTLNAAKVTIDPIGRVRRAGD